MIYKKLFIQLIVPAFLITSLRAQDFIIPKHITVTDKTSIELPRLLHALDSSSRYSLQIIKGINKILRMQPKNTTRATLYYLIIHWMIEKNHPILVDFIRSVPHRMLTHKYTDSITFEKQLLFESIHKKNNEALKALLERTSLETIYNQDENGITLLAYAQQIKNTHAYEVIALKIKELHNNKDYLTKSNLLQVGLGITVGIGIAFGLFLYGISSVLHGMAI